MSDSRPTVATNNNNEGQAVINWAQVPDDDIRYNTDDEEEVMRVKVKERKRQKVAEQAQQEEQAWLEAKRAEREKAEAERAAWEAEEERACEEEKCKAEQKHKAEARKSSEARAGGKCHWPGDGKVAEAGPKAIKGKKRKVDKENAEAKPSNQKQAKTSMRLTEILDLNDPEAGRSRPREASADRYSGLEDKLEHLIDAAGLIANNLASLFELHKITIENSGHITDALESILNESYGFRMAVSPLDSGSSKLNSGELHEEVEWLKTHGEDEEEESEGEDESMAEAK
ncbi:hypothetical protein M404DRAFT_30572 [Pisolithus tinctorius Marx 270]|uniref:Uncharacterized protein n=1 Tax=Pisolithus tinctorius Marx 270 TaxID=870435 RepID=A0A0C3IR14_PISTI|nr:hypothetical protein M404DRAFT_30572 [Pisolithus tinctorius Marx 270]